MKAMKITRLEIKGFKSFPDKTVFDFKPGITSVVGPNGCGKSNVMEAIRWAMGEQRARTLRGKKMEDVIFNGSDARKAVGMAEVSLVLSNGDGLAPPSMADYDEIMITRRLFRDGDSQYEINNIPCRLADVTDFFLDTGVGRNSYAIIEQGRVDMVVASKPEDRRVLIEEAAGINRYKSRKEAALKKLEQTEHNLRRISDVIGEVKRQSASLKRQASKAERYRKFSDKLRELDINIHAYKCRDIQVQYTQLKNELEESGAVLFEREALLSAATAELEQDRLKSLDTEKALKEVLEARHRTDIELTSLRGRMERDRGRVAQLQERQQRSLEERKALDERKEHVTLRRDELVENESKVSTDLKSATDELESALSQVQGIEETLNQQRRHLENLREDLFRILQETAQEKNRKEGLARRGAEIQAALARIAGEHNSVSAALVADRSERDQLVAARTELLKGRQEAGERKEGLVQERMRCAQKVTLLRADIGSQEKQLSGDRARLESLEEMQHDFSNYDNGVRFLMKDRDPDENGAVLGPVAEMIEVPAEYQKALAAALGERLGHLVVSSTRAGLAAANRLRDAGAGRSSFIPAHPRSGLEPHRGGVPEGLTRLQDVVRFREGCESLGDFLLGRCFVVDDIRQAVDIWERNGIQIDLVTSRGEVLNQHGVITGGSQDEAGEEVFEKRREIAELRDRVDALADSLAGLQSSLRQEEMLREKLALEVEETDRVINELNMKEIRFRKDLERLESQISASERRHAVLVLEEERLQKEQRGLADQLTRAEETIALLEKKRGDLETDREETTQSTEQLARVVQEKSAHSGEMRVKVAQLQERGRSLERERASVDESIRQIDRQISDLKEESARNAHDENLLTEELAQATGREKQLMQEHESQQDRIASFQNEAARLAQSVKDLEHKTAEIGRVVKDLSAAVHSREMDAVRLEQALDGLVEKIVERYHVDPRMSPCPDTPPQEEELAEIRQKLETMGEVNLAAIAESNQIEERLTFLTEQEEDLKKAVESLYATINAINKTTRERFREAFESVNEKFQEIFPFLFKGGQACLVLTDEEDLLETGVDIMARPPGKRFQNMDLLSGGEKALTAVGLIFAIFLTRPSPFCLLDEVDAPLDDANLVRFNEMLRQLADKTQFLIITHNKRSMEEADSLYGVTMEEPGVSRVVSVQFAQ